MRKILAIILTIIFAATPCYGQFISGGGGSASLSGGTQYFLTAWSAADSVTKLASAGTAGQVLVSGGAAAYPAWTTGVLSMGVNFTVQTGAVTLTGQAGGSDVTLPSTGTLLAADGDGSSLTGLQLDQFVTQTAWRIFYSNADGDIVELALGTDGYLLKAKGASAAPEWSNTFSAQIDDSAAQIVGNADNTKTLKIDVSTNLSANDDIILKVPDLADGTSDNFVTDTSTSTLTNKTLSAPIATLPRVNGSTALSLSAAQVSGTVIRNTGQALADVSHTLPVAAAGYNFIATVGTTLAATNYWRFTANTTPTPDDFMCLDGTCGKTYVSVDTPTMGDTLTCWTDQVSSTGLKNEADLGIGTSANTSVKNTVAVEFDIAGTGYSKAIAETAPGNDTVPQNKYGAVAFDIGADGTIDAIEASANATGYDSAALAIAGIAAAEAAHVRLGTVTAISTEAGGFVFGTTALSAANTTVAYTDTAVYTPPFNWICITGKGTWTTN